ncbi:MAG: hypothetical protein QXD23_02530 [Candidatus Micrarchaeaceae archaeon]
MTGLDFRGKQSNIIRLKFFDKFALIHMIFYRIITILGIIAGISIFIYVFTSSHEFLLISEYLILSIWIFFTPQLYEIVQVLNLKLTNAHISKYINNSFLISNNLKKNYFFLKAINIISILIWITLFIIYFKMLIL